jgi:hypothetical protein
MCQGVVPPRLRYLSTQPLPAAVEGPEAARAAQEYLWQQLLFVSSILSAAQTLLRSRSSLQGFVFRA